MNPAELVYGKYLPKWRDRNDQWAESSCPFPDHNDKNPSFGFHKIEGTYNCLGCNRKGNSVNFVAEMEGISVVEARKRVLDTGFDLDQTGVVERQGRAALNPQRSAPAEMPKETIDYAEICKHHAELLKDTNAMEYLTHERKWSLEKIVELKIGLMHHGQISIPLLEGTAVLNRKRFKKLGKKYAEKGSTTKYFYPRNLFGEDKILIVGGEPDAIAGQSVGLPTISSFGGEGVVPLDADLILLSGKEIGILYDNDTAGRRGAQVIAKKLSRVSHNVKILNISDICDGAKSGYDLTDFISDHRDPEENPRTTPTPSRRTPPGSSRWPLRPRTASGTSVLPCRSLRSSWPSLRTPTRSVRRPPSPAKTSGPRKHARAAQWRSRPSHGSQTH
jgi:hypothetical protein